MYDAPTLAALASGALVLRDFLTVQGRTLGGAAATFCYWTGEDNVTANVVPAGGSSAVARNFIGGATLLDVPAIVDVIGLEAEAISLAMDHVSTVVGSPMDMVYGNDVRVGKVELHRGVFDPATWALVSNPHLLFSGRVDGAEVDDAAAGGEGGLSLAVRNIVVELTKTSPAMESDEQLKLRSGDRFRRWGDTAGQVSRWWGSERGTAEASGRASGRGRN